MELNSYIGLLESLYATGICYWHRSHVVLELHDIIIFNSGTFCWDVS